MIIKLHLLPKKAANNLAMHVGTTIIFGGILEGVRPINNQKIIGCTTWDALENVE